MFQFIIECFISAAEADDNETCLQRGFPLRQERHLLPARAAASRRGPTQVWIRALKLRLRSVRPSGWKLAGRKKEGLEKPTMLIHSDNLLRPGKALGLPLHSSCVWRANLNRDCADAGDRRFIKSSRCSDNLADGKVLPMLFLSTLSALSLSEHRRTPGYGLAPSPTGFMQKLPSIRMNSKVRLISFDHGRLE